MGAVLIDASLIGRKGTFCILLTVLLSLPILVQAASRDHHGRYHALVIGNSDYAHLPKLETAVSDAIATAGLLRSKYGFDVTLLLNATQSQTLNFFDWLKGELTAKDRLLIYFAGHGRMDRGTDTGYWLPIDAKPADKTLWIAHESITKLLRAMAARHVIMIADSNFSGTQTRSAEVAAQRGVSRDEWIRRMAGKRARTAIVSGGLKPVAGTGGGGHSVFAKAFLSVLGDNDEVLDGQNLFQRLRGRIAVKADQTPRYSTIRRAGHEGGDFLFVPGKLKRADTPAETPKVSSSGGTAGTVDREALFWESVKDRQDAGSYQAYLNKYPNGLFSELARLRLQGLNTKQTAARQAREQAQNRESAAWKMVAASGGGAALRIFLQQYPDGANASLARIRLADLEASGRRETPKVAGLDQGPAAEMEKRGRFDGEWIAYIDECGWNTFGYAMRFDLQLKVTAGKYDLEITQSHSVGDFQYEISGSINSGGRLKKVTYFTDTDSDTTLTAQLPHGKEKGWFGVNECRVALKALSNVTKTTPTRTLRAEPNAPAGRETSKLGRADPRPASETANPGRFDGKWTAFIDECGKTIHGSSISYDIQVYVTEGRFDLELVLGFSSGYGRFKTSGLINSSGRFKKIVFIPGLDDDTTLTAQFPPGDGKAWFTVDRCRVALKDNS